MFLNANVQKVLGVFGRMTLIMIWAGFIQFSIVHAGVNGGRILYNPEKHVAEGEPIYVEAGFTTGIERASVYFRFPTDPAFTEVPMVMKMNGKYGAFLKKGGLKKGTILEYYIVAETPDGKTMTYPENNPEMLPMQIVVAEKAAVQEAGIETVVLSPDPGSTVNKNDFIIAISLFSDDTINVVNLRLTLDGGNDVTKKSDVTPELITYSNKNLPPGPHAARLWYTLPNGDKVILTEFSFDIAEEGGEDILAGKGFTAATAGQIQPGSESNFEDGKFRANFRAEHKAQNNLGQKTMYERAGADISYEKKFFQISASYDFDSEDDPAKNQPLSRYLVSANLNNIAFVNYGDSYPTFSPVTLYGTRVRGLSTGVYLGLFNFEFVKGEVNRRVISKQDKNLRNDLQDLYDANSNDVDRAAAIINYLNPDPDDPADDKTFTGTFKRELTAGRLSFGPQSFQLGISYVNTGDIEKSLYKQTLISTGYNGVAPKENVVFGADFKASMFSKRVNLDASVATGLTNENITGGTVDAQTLADANIIASGDVKKVQDMIDLVDKYFMTVNTNLSPIPTGADFITDKNNFAYTFGGSVNAYNNNFSARYRSHGGYFQTFGSSIQRDIQTFEISDRFRFWQNRVFLTVNYATSKNNLSKLNSNTLETQTVGTNLSLFLPKLPSLSFGYTTLNRDNNWEYLVDSNGLPEKSVTNIISLGTSYGFSAADLRHNATINYSISNKDDKTKAYVLPTTAYTPYQAAESNSFSLGLTTEWKFPLRTTVNFSTSAGTTRNAVTTGVDSGTVKKNESSATGFGVSGDYQVLNTDKLILNVYGGLSYTGVTIPNSPDLSLTSINLGQRFNFYKNHTFTLNFNLTSGLKIPEFDNLGNVTGNKTKINSLFSARYEYVF